MTGELIFNNENVEDKNTPIDKIEKIIDETLELVGIKDLKYEELNKLLAYLRKNTKIMKMKKY
ncbi:MAG: hypothetical protein ACRC03_16715 [Romboutsia sp.]